MAYFSNRLREERRRLGLNQEKFGALGGVKKDAQLNYEKGERNPDSAYLQALAEAGVDVLYVLTGVRAPISDDEQELLAGYRALDVRGKAGVLGMIDGMLPEKPTVQATFHGDVGQVVHGDVNGSNKINMPRKK